MKLNIDKYVLAVVFISVAVAFLTHIPELIAVFDHSGANIPFSGIKIIDVVSEIFFTFVSLLLLFALNTLLFGFNHPTARISWHKTIVSFLLTGIVSSLMGKGFVFLHQQFDIPAIDAMLHHYLHPLRGLIITGIVTGSCYIIHLVRKNHQVLIENEQLRSENLANQFEALKNQLNPHMLFNSLNTLGSLIREVPDRAQDYLLELSRVLRYTLQGNESMSVTLREEMAFVDAYNSLLKMRYEDNLKFDIQIDEDTETLQLPPMSVQLLIENAVKHNEISNRNPLAIKIRATENQLTVSNPIQRKKTASGGLQIGLSNLSKRYDLLFKKDIVIREKEQTFIVTIPLI